MAFLLKCFYAFVGTDDRNITSRFVILQSRLQFICFIESGNNADSKLLDTIVV